MAKKNKITIEESISSLPVEDLTLYTDVVKKVDPIAEKVISFRNKGFDNNRIAALLGIQKSIVDGIN
jgi:hypothetical protein